MNDNRVRLRVVAELEVTIPSPPADAEDAATIVHNKLDELPLTGDGLQVVRGTRVFASSAEPTRAEPAVVVIEMPAMAPRTRVSVERAASYLISAEKSYQTIANADVVVGRWGVERGGADGDDLYQTVLVVSKDRLGRSEGVTLDGTHIDPDLFTTGVPPEE